MRFQWLHFPLGLALVGLGPGCSNTYQQIGATPEGLILNSEALAYVARPVDFNDHLGAHPKTGEMTGAVFHNNLKPFLAQSHLATQPDHFTNLVSQALERNCQYLFIPTILEWADKQTRDSGVRDRIRIGIALFELPETNLLHQAELLGKSKWYGAQDIDVPEDLLMVPVKRYVEKLFNLRSPPPPVHLSK